MLQRQWENGEICTHSFCIVRLLFSSLEWLLFNNMFKTALLSSFICYFSCDYTLAYLSNFQHPPPDHIHCHTQTIPPYGRNPYTRRATQKFGESMKIKVFQITHRFLHIFQMILLVNHWASLQINSIKSILWFGTNFSVFYNL